MHLDGFKDEEVAEILGLSHGNVRVKLSRIREKLKRLMINENGKG